MKWEPFVVSPFLYCNVMGGTLFFCLPTPSTKDSPPNSSASKKSACNCTEVTCMVFLSAALQALKRKKRLEQQLTQIDGTLSTIEFQREALENSHTNTEVLKNMGYAAKAMKHVHENMCVPAGICNKSML